MQHATNYKEWKALAKQLDDLEGLNEWKYKAECKFYDYERVKTAIKDMKCHREAKNVKTLIHMLR